MAPLSNTHSLVQHFFSPLTRISLELPIDWKIEKESNDTVVYMHTAPSAKSNPLRLTVQLIPVLPTESQAYRQLAQPLRDLQPEHRLLLHHDETTVDGQPAVVNILKYKDTDSEEEWIQYQLFIHLPCLVARITGTAPETLQTTFIPLIEQIVQSLRFIMPEMKLKNRSFFDENTGISIELPENTPWEYRFADTKKFRLLAPPQSNYKNYRPSISYRKISLITLGDITMDQIVADRLTEIAQNYNTFTPLQEIQFLLNKNQPTHVQYYQWYDKRQTGWEFSQFQALVWADPSIYLINAAAIKPLAASYLPLFEKILLSTRIIPTP